MAHKDCSMQSNAIHVEEKDLLPRRHWITFSEGWAELNPVRNQNLYHHCQVGVKLQLTLHLLLLTTLQLAHLPSFSLLHYPPPPILAFWPVHTVPQAMEDKEAAGKMGRRSGGERRRGKVGGRKTRIRKMGRAENRERQGLIYTNHL